MVVCLGGIPPTISLFHPISPLFTPRVPRGGLGLEDEQLRSTPRNISGFSFTAGGWIFYTDTVYVQLERGFMSHAPRSSPTHGDE